MGLRSHRVRQATLTSVTCLLLLGAAGLPAAAQAGDLCGLLTSEDLSAALPGTYAAPAGMEGTCQWTGTTESGAGVLAIAYVLPGSATDMPGAQVIDIDGHPAFSTSDETLPVPTHVIGVETDDGLLVLTVSVDDTAIDVPSVTSSLVHAALARYLAGASAVSPSAVPAEATAISPADSPASADASPIVATGSVCQLAGPEEVAAALELDVELTVQDLEVACSWEARTDTEYVLIYAAQQDPGVLEALLGSIGAEEVDGPGDEDWWSSSLASLFSRQGDLALQVSYTSSTSPSEDELKTRSIAVMEALLAD